MYNCFTKGRHKKNRFFLGKSPKLWVGGGQVVHNCTIFLLPLDVRNIVQGGDPLYAGFFSTQGS